MVRRCNMLLALLLLACTVCLSLSFVPPRKTAITWTKTRFLCSRPRSSTTISSLPCRGTASTPATRSFPIQQPKSQPGISSTRLWDSSTSPPLSSSFDDDDDDSNGDDNAIPDPTEHGGTSSTTASTFNLVKSIVGAGVLSLPAGVAAYGNAPTAMIPAAVLIAVIGGMSGYCFYLIGRVCAYTGATSYREAWSKSVDESTSLLPAVSVTAKTTCAVLAYSMILADTFTSLAITIGLSGVTRTKTLLAITGSVLLPLCWLKNLSSLAPFSLLGTLGMVYTTLAMGVRYLQKAYVGVAPKFAVSSELSPSFGTVGASGALTPNVFILICMLSTAFMAHFNSPKFYTELKNNTLERFQRVVSVSFAISIALFALITSLGYLTFGAASDGLILNNYSTQDTLMSISRIAVAISLVFSYPLAFVGVREGLLDLFQIKKRTNKVYNVVTVTALSAITYAALLVKDVSFVLAFAGATLGNALIYVYPAFMFRGTVAKMSDASTRLKREAKLSHVMAAAGVVMGAIGSTMAIKSLG